jgi:hypothetical protein
LDPNRTYGRTALFDYLVGALLEDLFRLDVGRPDLAPFFCFFGNELAQVGR